MDTQALIPGPLALFGSGETSPSGQKVFDALFGALPHAPQVALLETPAGFELNSAQVIGRIEDFLRQHLRNYDPQVNVVAARRRNSPLSPDNPQIVAPLWDAELIFMGPGSPTYAVRQLKDSLAWNIVQACHRLGTALALASAATVAISSLALPVYEIYKVGEELHWKPGLDLFAAFGLNLVFIPHWNNNEGGKELDTSRCFMGQSRFAALSEMLPEGHTIIGIDEKTALWIDFAGRTCRVIGAGGVTLIHTGSEHPGAASTDELAGSGVAELAAQRGGHAHRFTHGSQFGLERLGAWRMPAPGFGLPAEIWEEAQMVKKDQLHAQKLEETQSEQAPAVVYSLMEARQQARLQKDWAEADRLRDAMLAMGWKVSDTPQGQELTRQ